MSIRALGFVVVFTAAFGTMAQAQWTVIPLHPDGADNSILFGVGDGQQVGFTTNGGATVWSGTAQSAVNLGPGVARGVGGGRQVGYSGTHAAMWSGTAASMVDLNPAGANSSDATSIDGDRQGGNAEFGSSTHAGMWSGTAASWTSLNPNGANGSGLWGMQGGHQVGYVRTDKFRASLWSGTADSWVDLHPSDAAASTAYDVFGNMQVGDANLNSRARASLWFGTAASRIDLNGSFESSSAFGIDGNYQVGAGWVSNTMRAVLWEGSAESRVDLHSMLGPGFLNSVAQDVWQDGQYVYVVGQGLNSATSRYEAVMWKKQAVPEPSTMVALGLGLAAVVAKRRRKTRLSQ